MKVIEMKNEIKTIEIKLGDMFKSANGDFYILVETDLKFEVISLDGDTRWDHDNSLVPVKSDLKTAIQNKRLIHYPQDKYRIVLEEI